MVHDVHPTAGSSDDDALKWELTMIGLDPQTYALW